MARLSSRPTRGTLQPTPLAEAFYTDTATDQRLWLRNVVVMAFSFRASRPARASPRGELADRPQSTRALADLVLVVVFAANAERAPPHAIGRGSSSTTPRQVSSCGFAMKCHRIQFPCRAIRARFASWRTGRPPTEHARVGGLGVVAFAANPGHAPPHAVGRGSSSPTPRQVGGYGFGST